MKHGITKITRINWPTGEEQLKVTLINSYYEIDISNKILKEEHQIKEKFIKGFNTSYKHYETSNDDSAMIIHMAQILNCIIIKINNEDWENFEKHEKDIDDKKEALIKETMKTDLGLRKIASNLVKPLLGGRK